jgi:uncharacterized protein (DUF3084 family)
METAGMKPILTLMAALLVVGGSAQASEVYKEKDAKGNTVYTDRPEALPAEKLNVKTQQTNTVEAKKRYEAEMQNYSSSSNAAESRSESAAERTKAAELTAEDAAKRCKDARDRYDQYMTARRLYEPGTTEGERRYLSDAEIDTARANAKKLMDQYCAGQ